ncbi:MAG: ATP-binding protein [Acidobacteriota bacterium]|nr:ATP-binding protein [Acidobacteriota bacterium]
MSTFSYDPNDEGRVEKILTEQRRLQLHISEQNRMLRERQQNLLTTLEQLQQREADASRMAILAQDALSELRDAQDRLVRTEKLAAIGHLAAAMSHELRNPLGAIRNAWFYIEMKVGAEKLDQRDPRIGEMSAIINDEIDRCARIIGDLLDFARERPVFRVPTSIQRLIADAIAVVIKPSPSIEVVAAVPDNLPSVFVDVDQFRQVFVNLVQNAVEIVDPRTGIVKVTAREDEGWFEVVVSDNGPGIPPDVQSRIFEPLFTTKTRGTGLGLSIVASIVKRHGGSISAGSELGSGAKFIVRFPGGEPSEGARPVVGGAADLR